MKFIPLIPSLREEWDKIAYCSDDAWLFHLYDWLDLEENAFAWESKGFLVAHDEKIIGIVPLQMNKKTRFLKSDLMGACGPALINDLDPSFRQKILKETYRYIEDFARQNASPGVEIYLPPLAESVLKDRWQINPLINFFYKDISSHTFIVDLTIGEELIISNLSKDARLQMKKAEKMGYTIHPASGIEEYYKVHCENYQRTGVSPHPKDFFTNIFEYICKKGYATIWEARDSNGIPVAFELIALFKKKAFYWTSCCKTDHLETGVNYLLQVHSMLWARSQGAQWFETGEAFPNAREGKEHGLTLFKEKFGGQLHRLLQGRLEILPGSLEANAFKIWVRAGISLIKSIFKIKK